MFSGSLKLKVRCCPESYLILLLQRCVGLPLGSKCSNFKKILKALRVVSDHPPGEEQSQHSWLSPRELATENMSNGTPCVKGQGGSDPLEPAPEKPSLLLAERFVWVPLGKR